MAHARQRILAALVIALALGGWAFLANDDADSMAATAADAKSPAIDRATARSAEGTDDVLFRIEPGNAPVPGSMEDSVPITISRQAALAAGRTGSMTVALPDGTRYPVRYERGESAPDGNWTFVGRVDTPLGALASVITFGPDGVFGTLPTPDGTTMKITTRAGQTFLQSAGWSVPPGVDPSKHPDYVMPPPSKATPNGQSSAVAARTIGQLAEEDGGEVTITILAAYTRNLSQLRGSAAAAQTEYRNLVAVMNQAHVDSGSRARFEIAGFVEVIYPAGEWNQEARADIIDNSLPDGTNLHVLRNQKSADLVALIRPYVEGDLTCGISQFPGPELEAHRLDPGTGFSVTAVEACAPLVFVHEIGHNLGLMHDRDTIAGPHGATLSYGAFPFSFGHRQLGPPGFATVMAYDSESRPRLGYFSHPDTTRCGGAACGDAELADNVRAINLTAGSIARFRDPPGIFVMDDRWVVEHENWGSWDEIANVRLSSPAPAGGVTFDIEVEGGSAEPGVDFDLPPASELTGIVFAQGQSSHNFGIRLHSDDIHEPPETIKIRLTNVRGNVAVPDDEATMTIVDRGEKVHIEGNVRFPPGAAKPASVVVRGFQFHEGLDAGYAWDEALAPDFAYSLEVVKGALVSIDPEAVLWARDVIVENADRTMRGIDIPLAAPVRLSGRLEAGGRGVSGAPVILWNPQGDGSGYYVNWSSSRYVASYGLDVLPGVSMQLEVRDPPAPYVRQIVEVPPLAQAATLILRLREVPSLTIPHVTVTEGTSADGARTVLLTASLSVPRSQTGVTFDIETVGTAGANDFQLPKTRISIPRFRSRVEVPIVVYGDDRSEPDEIVELRITNIQGAAWNPGPGSVRIASDDRRPGDGSCTGSTTEGSVRMCQ